MEPSGPGARFGPGRRTMTTLAVRANEFLAKRRIALVGVSRDPRDLSRTLFRELRRRGATWCRCTRSWRRSRRAVRPQAQDVSPGVDGALLMTRAKRMHRGAGRGARVRPGGRRVPPRAWDRGRGGRVSFMFLPRCRARTLGHGFLARLVGRHPGARAARGARGRRPQPVWQHRRVDPRRAPCRVERQRGERQQQDGPRRCRISPSPRTSPTRT
jgi:hypothetical protein